MDGIQFMHHPRFKDLTEKIHKKRSIGTVQRVISSFRFELRPAYIPSFHLTPLSLPSPIQFNKQQTNSVPCLNDENIRNVPELEPLGVLGDLGIHNIRLSLWAFDYEQPILIKAICHKRNEAGAMQDISCWLFFSGDRVASFDCSYHCPLRQHVKHSLSPFSFLHSPLSRLGDKSQAISFYSQSSIKERQRGNKNKQHTQ